MINSINIRGYDIDYYKNDNVIGECFSKGYWWDYEKKILIEKHRIKNKDLLDIGAFIGSTSILMSEIIKNENNQVHAFEPTYFECLEKNINQNNLSDKIKIHNVGLSNVELYVPPPRDNFDDTGNYGGLSLVNNHINSTKSILEDKGKNNIKIKKLDDFNFKNIGFIKIDVEGMELEVLEGAKSTLIENNLPPILIEVWDVVGWRRDFPEYFINNQRRIFNFLTELGYKPHENFTTEKDYLFTAEKDNMIPKIIHQTWIDENIPAKNRFCVQSWKRLNPDYEYKFWTNEILIRFVEKEYPHYLNLLWKFKLGIQLADFFRLLILYHYGGIYVDIDFECLKPINTWELDDSKINFAYEPKEHRLDSYSIICNALICSPKRLESLIELIDSGEPIIDENPYEVMNSYGPWRCTNFYVENLNFRDNVNIIPTDLYYPIPDIFHETLYYDNNVRDKYIEKIEKKDFGNSNAVHYWDHSNVDKPSILKGLYHVYHANAEKEVIDLKNITLVCIDTISSNEEKCHTAIIKSTENIQFNSVKYFTYDIKNKLKGIEYIKIPELECINDYSKFCLTELHKYIDTDFCLIIQHDGYVINPNSWDSKFLDFDYIGAPWADPLIKHKVGNGGFSLRSKKLLETTSRIFKNYPNIKIKNTVWENDILKEDWLICNAYYDEMIYEGIKFADVDIASCFSVEHPHSKMKPNPFGFHDYLKDTGPNKNNTMKIVCILTVWNEIDYLPIKVEYCRQNKLEPYFIDNMSTDGTWEWLQKNNIPSHRIDTNDSFDLRRLQDEIVKTLHVLKPDWVVYNGCDLFPVTLTPLYDEIEKLDKRGYNTAWIECINFFNTGEERKGFDPFNTYFYYDSVRRFKMIHKYNTVLQYCADDVSFPGQRIGNINGVMINYGDTKTKEERAETLKRRKKAWLTGMPLAHGAHYIDGEKNNWVWDKNELNDVRESKYYPYIQKLQKMTSGNINFKI